MPEVSDTYLHRVGRAGRFGTKGLAITFVSNDEDAKTLEDVQSRFEVSITQLPETIDVSSYMNHSCSPTCWFVDGGSDYTGLMVAARDISPGEEIT